MKNNILLYYYIIINIITLSIFYIDKYKAKKNLWRIKEKTLFSLIILGGFIGAFLAFAFIRHKNKKISFWVISLASLLIHLYLINKYFGLLF